MSIISLAEYKAMLGIHGITNDSMVNTLIPVVQSSIETYLDRSLDTATYYEWKPYSSMMLMDQYPIQSVSFIGSLWKMASFTPVDGYGYQINSAYTTTNTNSGLTITKDADFTTKTFPFSVSTHLEELQTQVEAAYPGVITLTIDDGYDFVNWRLLKSGTGSDIYGAKRFECNTRIVDNRTIEFTQEAGFLFVNRLNLYNMDIFVIYSAGYATADVPQTIKLVAANVIKNIVNIQTSGQGTPGARSGFYTMEQWQPATQSYMYQVADVTVLEIAKQVERYEKMLFPFRKKVV